MHFSFLHAVSRVTVWPSGCPMGCKRKKILLEKKCQRDLPQENEARIFNLKSPTPRQLDDFFFKWRRWKWIPETRNYNFKSSGSGLKKESTRSSVTSSSVVGFHFGWLSLSTNKARTPAKIQRNNKLSKAKKLKRSSDLGFKSVSEGLLFLNWKTKPFKLKFKRDPKTFSWRIVAVHC